MYSGRNSCACARNPSMSVLAASGTTYAISRFSPSATARATTTACARPRYLASTLSISASSTR